MTTEPPEHASGNASGQASRSDYCPNISLRRFGAGVRAAGDGIPSQNGVPRRGSGVVSGRMGRT